MPQVRKRGPYGGLTDKEVEEWRTICNFHESFHGGAGSGESDALRDRLGHIARFLMSGLCQNMMGRRHCSATLARDKYLRPLERL